MKARVIVNPVSGRRSVMPVVESLRTELERAGWGVEVCPTQGSGDATRLAADASVETRVVVVAGGDGTVREVVEGLEGRDLPIAVLPAGTENVLAKHFGYRCEAAHLVRTILHGAEIAYDVGVCNGRHGNSRRNGRYNGQRFILMVGVGFDAEVIRRLAAVRTGHISYKSYVVPVWRAFWSYRFPAVRVEVDGRRVFEGRAMVWAGIIPRYALGAQILDQARTDDGLLDVRILPGDTRWQLASYAASVLARLRLRRKDVQYHQCKTVSIKPLEAEPVNVQIDGDCAGSLPVECGIVAPGVRFLIPEADR